MGLVEFIINEKEFLKQHIQPLICEKDLLIKNEPPVFHDIIKEQFNEAVRKIIIEEYCKGFTMTPEEAIINLEGINLEDFFKC